MRRAPAPLDAMLEKEWDAALFNAKKGLAPSLGWSLCYHTLRSKGSASGFPDRVLVRERVIFAELKREKTGPTPGQVEWLDGLAAAGAEVYLWRPSDLDEIGLVLGKRWSYLRTVTPGLGHLDPKYHQGQVLDFWTPRCLWVGGGTHGEMVEKAAAA